MAVDLAEPYRLLDFLEGSLQAPFSDNPLISEDEDVKTYVARMLWRTFDTRLHTGLFFRNRKSNRIGMIEMMRQRGDRCLLLLGLSPETAEASAGREFYIGIGSGSYGYVASQVTEPGTARLFTRLSHKFGHYARALTETRDEVLMSSSYRINLGRAIR